MVWDQKVWVRGYYGRFDEFCKKTKQHRFGATHIMPQDKSIQYRSCRRCGVREFTKFEVIDGKIYQTVMEIHDKEIATCDHCATDGMSIVDGAVVNKTTGPKKADETGKPGEATK